MAEEVDAADALHHFHRPALHRARVHAQRTAQVAGNAFHEFEAAEVMLACLRDNLLEPRARADSDPFALDFDAAEVGPSQMHAEPEDAALAHEKIAAAPDERDRNARDRGQSAGRA